MIAGLEDPEFTSSHGHTEITGIHTQLTLKMTWTLVSRPSTVNCRQEAILKMVGWVEIWLGTKFLVRITTCGEAKGSDLCIRHPQYWGLALERQIPITFGLENQWGLTLEEPESDRKQGPTLKKPVLINKSAWDTREKQQFKKCLGYT